MRADTGDREGMSARWNGHMSYMLQGREEWRWCIKWEEDARDSDVNGA